MSEVQIKLLYKRFKDGGGGGGEFVEIDPCFGISLRSRTSENGELSTNCDRQSV